MSLAHVTSRLPQGGTMRVCLPAAPCPFPSPSSSASASTCRSLLSPSFLPRVSRSAKSVPAKGTRIQASSASSLVELRSHETMSRYVISFYPPLPLSPPIALAPPPHTHPLQPPSRWADTAVGFWTFEGHRVRYLRSGESGPPLLLVHGFGGNADHWRQSVAALARDGFRVYAIDLLGYGASDKPAPDPTNPNTLYNFERWATQLLAFTTEIVTEPVTLVSNSVGGIASLEAAIMQPDLVHSIQLMDISLRMLHTDRQPVWQRPLTTAFQKLLREGPAGRWFFSQVAKPETVKNILRQAYGDPQRVTDELVDVILTPGLAPGATEVFLDFIRCVSMDDR